MRDGVTIDDIARRANVSKSTVSRVLNGTAVVNEQKRDAVRQAINELGYKPNMFAQSLASSKSMVLQGIRIKPRPRQADSLNVLCSKREFIELLHRESSEKGYIADRIYREEL